MPINGEDAFKALRRRVNNNAVHLSKFVLHPEAGSDLNEIWEYIAADSLDAADRVVNEI